MSLLVTQNLSLILDLMKSTNNLLDYWDDWIDPQSETESQPYNSDEEIIHLDDFD